MNAKSGTAGQAIEPIEPAVADEADVADPGEVAKVKAEQVSLQKGKYGSAKTKPYKPPAAADSDEQGDDQEEEEEKPTSWIEVELVDEADEPVAGVRYRVTMPDGETVDEGVLDQNGWVRIDGIEKGSCKVSFPELDQDAWEFIESVGTKVVKEPV